MSRASRFIPRTQKKSKSINAHNVSIIRNVYRLILTDIATAFKKSWKLGEEVT
ncbi:hypothetical protein K732_03952 [Salmonella enterica subsp. enterica serovar Saintpaul str. S-70]|nr:hypothetical protein K732_03952 [Salmonella enterica subsp. enterica serovar Saintpaul str. S-70]